MRKKILALTLCAVMVFSLAACKKNNNENDTTTSQESTFAEEATSANLVVDKGQFAEEYFNNNNAITIAGKNANVLANGKTLVGKTVASPALKGNYTVEQTISFETTENRARVFLVVLA